MLFEVVFTASEGADGTNEEVLLVAFIRKDISECVDLREEAFLVCHLISADAGVQRQTGSLCKDSADRPGRVNAGMAASEKIRVGKADVIRGKLSQFRNIVLVKSTAVGFICVSAFHGFQININQVSFLLRECHPGARRIYVVVFHNRVVGTLIIQIIFDVKRCPDVVD